MLLFMLMENILFMARKMFDQQKRWENSKH